MPTARALVTRAYRLIGVKATGYTLSAEETADGLEVLNAMLRAWQGEGLLVPYQTQANFTLTADQASHTWGSGGDLNGTKPLFLHAAFIRHQSRDYPVDSIPAATWSGIAGKSQSGLPRFVWFQPGDTLATLRFDRVPAEAYDFHTTALLPLTVFTSLSTDDSLPDEYESAVAYNLAVDLAPEHGQEVSRTVAARASQYKNALEAQNLANRVPLLHADPALLRRRQSFNFTAGD